MSQTFDYSAPVTSASELTQRRRRRWLTWLLSIGVVVALFLLLNSPRSRHQPLPLSEFTSLLADNAVARIAITEDELRGQLKQNRHPSITLFRTTLPAGTTSDWTFTNWLLANRGDAVVEADQGDNLWLRVLLPLIPWFLIFGFLWLVLSRIIRKSQQRTSPVPVVVVNREPG